MDPTSETAFSDSIVVTGIGICAPDPFPREGPAPDIDVLPWLRSRKTRKFMGKQDELAVVAAGRALKNTQASQELLSGERTGLYMAVGYIPFERADIDSLVHHSMRAGQFSMEQFSTEGIEQVNPLLTFRCLPNMPIFHVSTNFGIQGPYFINYPAIGQFYIALERAIVALKRGRIELALVGGVADQRNFLVDYHLRRMAPGLQPLARDGAAFLCVERRSSAERRSVEPRFRLESFELGYEPHDPMSTPPPLQEKFSAADQSVSSPPGYWGPASLGMELAGSLQAGRSYTHAFRAPDGVRASSQWRAL
jgi:hypothetical protein